MWGALVLPGISPTPTPQQSVVASLNRPDISNCCLGRFVQSISYRILQPSNCFFPAVNAHPRKSAFLSDPRCRHVGSHFATLAVCSMWSEQRSKHAVRFLQSPSHVHRAAWGLGHCSCRLGSGKRRRPTALVPLTGKRGALFGHHGLCGVATLGFRMVKRGGEDNSVGVGKANLLMKRFEYE